MRGAEFYLPLSALRKAKASLELPARRWCHGTYGVPRPGVQRAACATSKAQEAKASLELPARRWCHGTACVQHRLRAAPPACGTAGVRRALPQKRTKLKPHLSFLRYAASGARMHTLKQADAQQAQRRSRPTPSRLSGAAGRRPAGSAAHRPTPSRAQQAHAVCSRVAAYARARIVSGSRTSPSRRSVYLEPGSA